MDTQMKIDASALRSLREKKSWSQEHLATAAGLSTRTVQRVEAEGAGSAETRLALAGALDVPVSELAPPMVSAPSTGYRESPRESRRLVGVSHAAMASSRVC